MAASRELAEGWQCCATASGECADPLALSNADCAWLETRVPGTAAGALRAAGKWSIDGPERRFDAEDWWYRLTFDCPAPLRHDAVLELDGLATIADAWLNGQHVLHSENMFIEHRCPVSQVIGERNELYLRFHALDEVLARKRPRPAWRAPMIEHQQLRWYRTTVLGRTPGWSPPCPAVGPWKGIRIASPGHAPLSLSLQTTVRDGSGVVTVACRADEGELIVSGRGEEHVLRLAPLADGRHGGELTIPRVHLWWPHTHGDPVLYEAVLRLRRGDQPPTTHPLGSIGFRTVELETADGDFRIRINGADVFCRGACWTPIDPVTLHVEAAAYETPLAQVVAAGMNMLRVSGATAYESDAFYSRCDALGILVWQDFMFANMDFPEQDAAFVDSAVTESRQLLNRLHRHPCLTLICGNSEVEQQAAMWGAARERWCQELFHTTLRGVAAECCPHTPYWPSSSHGGAVPHDGATGTTSYYGVGAYLQPLQDVRRTTIRFAAECLAFANVPEPATIDRMPGGARVRVHHPAWKSRVPRELGPGWDFEDVRDHYVRLLFNLDPAAVRYSDHERYLTLGRVTVSEVITTVMSAWRRHESPCRGALVWFLRDLWAGAGWGLVSSDGVPKSAYYAMRRCCQPVHVSLLDEATNGLDVHISNERSEGISATLQLRLYRDGERLIDQGSRLIALLPRQTLRLSAGTLFDHFHDFTYAYRFGPPAHDLVHAQLLSADGDLLAECHYLPLGVSSLATRDVGLKVAAMPDRDGMPCLTISADRYAHAVRVDVAGYVSSDSYFNLAPATSRVVRLQSAAAHAGAMGRGLRRGLISALNSSATINVSLTS
jgi:beta-mannosidase